VKLGLQTILSTPVFTRRMYNDWAVMVCWAVMIVFADVGLLAFI
jgi:hypothetical protein